MTKIISMLSILLIAGCSFAGNPPAAVKNAFEKKFPGATSVSWGKENAQEWEAEFTLNGKKISANFQVDGTWVETEEPINKEELPKAVLSVIEKQYPGWAIMETDKTETAKNGTIYEADLKNGAKKLSLAFKEDGTTVKE
ncbi:MAG: PepSY-like domain-containing protein [Bacteroidales bacterium]|nr:PepSY-like domain-containing protein [Bacteroidales bacterium]HNW74407.1 PepSY-like domain-containing protein [Bacteroidales bacterium]HPS51391.1 PepSY-like domain-containing protein [Bacteroidales bacterium]